MSHFAVSHSSHANHPHIQPLQGPGCWDAKALTDSGDWVYQLTPTEIDDVNAATASCAGTDVESITLADFKLPVFATRLATIRAAILDGKGLALVRGLPVKEHDEDGVSRLLWGIGLHFGVPQPQDAAGALLHHVRDTGAKVAGQANIRTFQTNEAQPWHNDGGDMFLLLCRQVASSGGKSYVASTQHVFNALLQRDPELARVLQADFHFDARGQELPGHGPVQSVPIFTWHAEHMFMLHKRHYIDLAQRFPEVPRLTPLQTVAIDAIEAICNDPSVHYAFHLEPGDLEIANNFAVLHKRGAFDQSLGDVSQRHMLRLWLGLPDGWPLPETYRETREYGPLFDVRAAS